ncbi:MAG TPA: hypothetical protein VK867_01440 [Candidatus Limnocylindrales bacterium]|nr:hypothetical protein [Candidatus Limnocylindrales bacterium]
MLGLATSFLAGFAALVASQVGDVDYVPFFIGLAFVAAVEAWAAREPLTGVHRSIARVAAIVWLVAATWVAVLWLWYAAYTGASRPPPGPPLTFLAIPVAAYYVIGLYAGAVLVTLSAFRRVPDTRSAAEEAASLPPGTP